jgi:hypothetical protein
VRWHQGPCHLERRPEVIRVEDVAPGGDPRRSGRECSFPERCRPGGGVPP